MRRNSRPVRECSLADGEFYFRWYSDWMDNDLAVRSDNLQPPNQSVNCGSWGGRPWYVLIPDPMQPKTAADETARQRRRLCMGIVAALTVPDDYVEGSVTYHFALEHDPLEYNYHHCEIRVYRDGQRLSDADLSKGPGKKAKKHYRIRLAEHCRIILLPEVGTSATTRRRRLPL